MPRYFKIAERGAGSYRMLAILRWVMVLVFLAFGIQKFTPQSANGIVTYISNSPFVWWLSIFGVRGEANLLGVVELCTGILLAAGAFSPFISALGSLMGVATFLITWSFFFTTPGVVHWSISTDPIAWNLMGEFLFKDIVLLSVCVVLFLASLSRNSFPAGQEKVSQPSQFRAQPADRDWSKRPGGSAPLPCLTHHGLSEAALGSKPNQVSRRGVPL